MRKMLAGLLIGCALVGGWIAYQWYAARSIQLSRQPEQTRVQGYTPEDQDSTVYPVVSVSFGFINDALNKAADALGGARQERYNIGCFEPKVGSAILARECLDIDWEVAYGRNGPIVVSARNSNLVVDLPIKLSGRANFNGDIAKLLSLKKSFEGTFRAVVEANVTFGSNYCPSVRIVNVSFDHTFSFELIGRSDFKVSGVGFSFGPWNLNVSALTNEILRRQLTTVLTSAARNLPCSPIQDALRKYWHSYAVSFPVPDAGPMFLNIRPWWLNVPSPAVNSSGIVLRAQLGFTSSISSERGKEEDLGQVIGLQSPPLAPSIAVTMPVSLGFSYIEQMANGRRLVWKASTPAGEVTLTPTAFQIYQTEDTKVAVGVTFSADVPGNMFDVNGTVWLTANPTVSDDGLQFRFEDVNLTEKLDNRFWDVLAAVLHDNIENFLNQSASIDLSGYRVSALATIRTYLQTAQLMPGLKLNMKDEDVRLAYARVDADRVTVAAKFSASLIALLDRP